MTSTSQSDARRNDWAALASLLLVYAFVSPLLALSRLSGRSRLA